MVMFQSIHRSFVIVMISGYLKLLFNFIYSWTSYTLDRMLSWLCCVCNMLFCWYLMLVGLFLLSETGFNLNVKVERVWWEDSLSCGSFFCILFSGSLRAPIHYQKKKDRGRKLAQRDPYRFVCKEMLRRSWHSWDVQASSWLHWKIFILFLSLGWYRLPLCSVLTSITDSGKENDQSSGKRTRLIKTGVYFFMQEHSWWKEWSTV